MTVLENCVREDLDQDCRRVMAVLHPLRIVITNYPDGGSEELDAPYHPNRPELGSRKVPFSKIVYIEREDFMEEPPKKFFRLAPGREVRLRYAYFIKCTGVIKDSVSGEITELHCTYDPATRGGNAPDGRKVKGTLHWVSAAHSVAAEVRLYDRLFSVPDPGRASDWRTLLNPESMRIIREARLEPQLAGAGAEERFQFERLGYFCVDRRDAAPGRPVFNRTVTLKDSWAKENRG
jgi:glutaminyl-tRNA synthetase